MKKRALYLLCIVLASLCILTACDKSATAITDKSARKAPATFGSISEPTTVKGIIGDSNDEFVVLLDQPDLKALTYISRVYSLSAGKVVYEDEKPLTDPTVRLLGYGLFAVRTKNGAKVLTTDKEDEKLIADTSTGDEWTLFNEQGKTVMTLRGKLEIEDELLFVEHTIYKMSDGKVKKTSIRWNEGERMYDRIGEYRFRSDKEGCYVYDLGGNLLSAYRFPDYAADDQRVCVMLAGGHVLIQYTEQIGTKDEDIPAKKYDIIRGDGLYQLHTFIMNPKTGKLKTLSLKQIIATVAPAGQADDIAKGIDNLALLYPIDSNKRINTASTAYRLVVMDNNGAVSDVDKLHPAQQNLPSPVGKSNWQIHCVDGHQWLCDKSGKLLADCTDSDTCIGYDYYATKYAIYDMNGKLTYDLTAEGRTVAMAGELCAVLKDAAGNSYIYADGKVTDFLINSKEVVSRVTDNLIFTAVVDTTGSTVTVYNHRGEKLLRYDGATVNTVEGKKATYLIAGDVEKMETSIYKLSNK